MPCDAASADKVKCDGHKSGCPGLTYCCGHEPGACGKNWKLLNGVYGMTDNTPDVTKPDGDENTNSDDSKDKKKDDSSNFGQTGTKESEILVNHDEEGSSSSKKSYSILILIAATLFMYII